MVKKVQWGQALFILIICSFSIMLNSGFSLLKRDSAGVISASGLIEADVYEVSAEPLKLEQFSRSSVKQASSEPQNRFLPIGRTAAVFVNPGDEVKQGDVLLKLDDTAARLQLEQAKAKVTLLETSLGLIESKLEDIGDGLSKVNSAIDQLESKMKQVRAARSQYEALMAQLAAAQTALVRAQATGDAAQIARAQAGLQSVTGALAQLQAGMQATMGSGLPAGETVDLSSVIAKMVSSLEKAKSARSSLYTAETNLMVQQATLPYQIESARTGVRMAETQLKKAELKAPIGGWVLKGNTHPGEAVFSNSVLMKITDLTKVKLKLFIPLSQAGRIRQGQKAEVTIDSYPDRTFRGEVSRIGSKVQFMPSDVLSEDQSATLVVSVVLTIDNPDLVLKPGMPADAIIQ